MELLERARSPFDNILARIFKNTSFESMLMANVIVMLIMSITCTGFVMGKDAERNIGFRISGNIAQVAEPLGLYLDSGYTAALDMLKLDKAPSVVGLKEDAAKTKLVKANVDTEKINIKHETITYTSLVEKSDTLFFGEVEEQRISKDGITLGIYVADMNDPFTVQMNAMGSRLAWPVPGYERLSSHFGHRASPGGIGSTNHQGIDIPAPTGKDIIAVKAGKVETAGRLGGYGNCVVIDHQNGFKSLYGHMSRITCNAGDVVKPGDVIGKIGSTGWSTGSHLHFGLSKDGQFIDPEPFFTGKENLAAGEEVSENTTGTDETDTSTEDSTRSTKESESTEKDKKNTTKPTTKKHTTTTVHKPDSTQGGSDSSEGSGSSDSSGGSGGSGGSGDSGGGSSEGGNNEPVTHPTTQPDNGGANSNNTP